MTAVAVIIPTFNRATVLPRALDSVLQQTRQADEVIVVDDGSSDETAMLIQHHYPQVNYLYQDNKGVSAARNLGINTASADWLAFLDSDDAWQASKLEQQIDNLSSSSKLIHCDEIWIRHGKRVNPMQKHAKSGGWIYQQCLPLCAISPSAALLHRSLFTELGQFDETLPACEDYDLWLRICACNPVDYLDQALVIKYGGHDDQLSRKYWGMDRFRITALEKILASNVLSIENRLLTLQTLLNKLEVYLAGAKKRNKAEEIKRYSEKQTRYAEQLQVISS